jgi:hypothetical protein
MDSRVLGPMPLLDFSPIVRYSRTIVNLSIPLNNF